MQNTGRRLLIGIAVVCATASGLAIYLYPYVQRCSTYCHIRQNIEAGLESAAQQEIESAVVAGFDLDYRPWEDIGQIPGGHWIYKHFPSSGRSGMTLLLHAARHGQATLVQRIIELQGHIDPYGCGGIAALREAVVGQNPSVVRILLEHGADVTVTNVYPNHMSIMHFAVGFKTTTNIMELLLASEASINAVDLAGRTPLDWADMYNTNAVPFLLEHGAVRGKSLGEMHNPTSEGIRQPADGSPKPSM